MRLRILAVIFSLYTSLISIDLHGESVEISGLKVRRIDNAVTLEWKANVKTATFMIYRAGWQIRSTNLMMSAIRIADFQAVGVRSGKLFRFPAYADTTPTDEPYYYLVLPEQDHYDPSDFRPDQNYNTRPAETGVPIIDRVRDGLRVRVSYIQFAWNKADILPQSGSRLDQIAALLKKILADPKSYGLEKTSVIEISGHTDDTGSHTRNVSLSRRRAQAVKNEMVKRGLDETIMTTEGYGDWRPMLKITPDLTEEEKIVYRELNRRVEFFIKK